MADDIVTDDDDDGDNNKKIKCTMGGKASSLCERSGGEKISGVAG